jgi:hypothetical protein
MWAGTELPVASRGSESVPAARTVPPPLLSRWSAHVPWQRLNFFPLPHGQRSLRPTRGTTFIGTPDASTIPISGSMVEKTPLSVAATRNAPRIESVACSL